MSMSGPGSAVGRGGFTRSAGAAAGRGVLLIVFALAIGIQGAINRISPTASLGLFFVYAATMGFTIALIVSFYTTASVASAFFAAAAMFGAALEMATHRSSAVR